MYDKEEDITISQVTIMNPEATKVSQSINSQSMIAKGNAEKPIENKDVKEVKLPNKSVKKRDETIHPTKLKFTEEKIGKKEEEIKNMSNREKDDKHKNKRKGEEKTKEKHKEKIKSKDDKDQIKIDSKKYNKEIEKKNLKDYNSTAHTALIGGVEAFVSCQLHSPHSPSAKLQNLIGHIWRSR